MSNGKMNSPIRPNEVHNRVQTRASLLARLKNLEDHQSWQDFFDTYWGLLYRFALGKGLSESDAEEAVQETVIVVANKIREFDYRPETARFSTWLHEIAKRHVAKQKAKKPRINPSFGEDGDSGGAFPGIEEIPDPATSTPDALWQAEWERNVLAVATERAKGAANAAEFQCYDYFVVQGHGAKQTASDLGCAVNTVYSAKRRVMKLIKKEVERLRVEAF